MGHTVHLPQLKFREDISDILSLGTLLYTVS